MDTSNTSLQFLHSGRASACACRNLEGERCPDCQHLLTGTLHMVEGGEQRLQHGETKCVVCGRIVSDENQKKPRDIQLTVKNIEQQNKSLL